MSKGYVYILGNESMSGYYKIGMTTRTPEERAAQLYQTGVPTRFDIIDHYYSPDCAQLEITVHERLDEFRYNPDREFFFGDLSLFQKTLRDAHREQVEVWLDDFIPDQSIVDADHCVDLGGFKDSVYEAMDSLSITPPSFVEVLYQLEGHEVAKAARRQVKICEDRVEQYKARQSESKSE